MQYESWPTYLFAAHFPLFIQRVDKTGSKYTLFKTPLPASQLHAYQNTI